MRAVGRVPVSSRASMIYRASVNRLVVGDRDFLGQDVTTDTEIYYDLPCFVSPQSGDLTFTTGRAAEIVSHRGVVPFDADIEPEDRLTVSSRSGETLFENMRVLAVLLSPKMHKQLDLHTIS